MNPIVAASFRDEIIKIAQMTTPQQAEFRRIQSNPPRPRPINKDIAKQFAQNTAMVALGGALGEGLATLSMMGLRGIGRRYGKTIPPALHNVARGVFVPGAAAAGGLAYGLMRQRAAERLRAKETQSAPRLPQPTDPESMTRGYEGRVPR